MKNYFYLLFFSFIFFISCSTDRIVSLPNKIVVNLGADSFTLVSPQGYCINQETQRRHSSGFSIIFSDCFSIYSNNTKILVRSPVRSLVTVTISDSKIASDVEVEALDSFIMSGGFDTSFSRNSNYKTLTTLKKSKSKGVYYMCFNEAEAASEMDAVFQSKNFCRALFILNHRIVSIVGSDYSTQYTDRNMIESLVEETALMIMSANMVDEV